MPKAILAMRRYPATLLLAMFLFLATLILTAGSLGTVGSGGDDGDGGSGIGGTGKSGEFGGSGFGGTGGPSPFFTSVDSTTRQEEDDTSQPSIAPSAGLAIEIAQSIEQNALTLETQQSIAITEDIAPSPEPLLEKQELPVQLAEAPALNDTTRSRMDVPPEAVTVAPPAELAIPASGNDLAVSDQSKESAAPTATVTANAALAPDVLPAESMTVAHESEEEATQDTVNRAGIPERIQRPDLPPFQRIRPVERPSLLPSRVQPMRI